MESNFANLMLVIRLNGSQFLKVCNFAGVNLQGILHFGIFTFLVYLLKSPMVNHWNVMQLYYNNNIESRDVSDAEVNHGSLQSDWTSALSRS